MCGAVCVCTPPPVSNLLKGEKVRLTNFWSSKKLQSLTTFLEGLTGEQYLDSNCKMFPNSPTRPMLPQLLNREVLYRHLLLFYPHFLFQWTFRWKEAVTIHNEGKCCFSYQNQTCYTCDIGYIGLDIICGIICISLYVWYDSCLPYHLLADPYITRISHVLEC